MHDSVISFLRNKAHKTERYNRTSDVNTATNCSFERSWLFLVMRCDHICLLVLLLSESKLITVCGTMIFSAFSWI